MVDNGLVSGLTLRRLGTGMNHAGAVPVYGGWEALRSGLGTAEMDDLPVLWLFPCDREMVRLSGVSLWEGLGDALEGIGRWQGVTVAVYTRDKALQAVDNSIVDVPDSAPEQLARVVAQRIVDEQVIPANIGMDTPFFLT